MLGFQQWGDQSTQRSRTASTNRLMLMETVGCNQPRRGVFSEQKLLPCSRTWSHFTEFNISFVWQELNYLANTFTVTISRASTTPTNRIDAKEDIKCGVLSRIPKSCCNVWVVTGHESMHDKPANNICIKMIHAGARSAETRPSCWVDLIWH